MKTRTSKRVKKIALYVGIIVLVVTSSTAYLSYRVYNAKLIGEREKFMRQIEQDRQQIEMYEKKTLTGWVLTADKNAGDEIKESDVQQTRLPDYFIPQNVITKKEDIVGKIIKINALKTTAITEEMVYADGPLKASERKEEVEYVKLPYKLQKEDTVDIRIVFPNGEDYIVVAKKKITDFDYNNQIAYFTDDEEEALMLQSALVDAYINNAELYMRIYVEPEMQDKPVANYVPNADVLLVMESNPDIIKTARAELAKELRDGLERRLDAIDPQDSVRVGADSPLGSAVGKRKNGNGASSSGQAQSQSQNNQGVGVDKGVNEMVDPNYSTNNNPQVLQPSASTGSGNTSSPNNSPSPNSVDANTQKQNVGTTPTDNGSNGDTNLPDLLGGE